MSPMIRLKVVVGFSSKVEGPRYVNENILHLMHYFAAIPLDELDNEVGYPFRHTSHFHTVARKGLVNQIVQKLNATFRLLVCLTEAYEMA